MNGRYVAPPRAGRGQRTTSRGVTCCQKWRAVVLGSTVWLGAAECVEQCCLFAMGGNFEPPPPVQHDAHAHRGSDHDHSRGRPPVRDDGCQDGNAHAGQDRMPLGARSPLHVFTLTAVEHHELTPWIRFGNRQSVHELATKADGATTSSSRTRPIRSRSTNRSDPSPICRRPLDDVSRIFFARCRRSRCRHQAPRCRS
jgi:hypothetical protein